MTSRQIAERASSAEPVRVFHVIPENGIGGVEIMANQAVETIGGALWVQYLHSQDHHERHSEFVSHGPAPSALSLRNAAAALRQARRFDPDVVVFSLWKSVCAFLLFRLFLRGPRFVLFVHSDQSVHLLDHVATAIMVRLSDSIWADSIRSATGRIGKPAGQRRARVISFVRRRPIKFSSLNARPNFLYWGRLHKIKRVDRAVDLFSQVAARHNSAHFKIVGPDAGSRSELENQVIGLGLGNQVEFVGPMAIESIETLLDEASFFIHLSSQEGAAMSVIEAMQFGLVPIVTPVGAIGDYCVDGMNSILFDNLESTADRIEEVIIDQSLYRSLRQSAIAKWQNEPLYHEDLLMAAAAETDRRRARTEGTNQAATIDQY